MSDIDIPDLIQEISINARERSLAKKLCKDIFKLMMTHGVSASRENVQKYLSWQLTQYRFDVLAAAEGSSKFIEIFKDGSVRTYERLP